MTTQTPTNSTPGSQADPGHDQGLLDIDSLVTMANAFFRAIPGTDPQLPAVSPRQANTADSGFPASQALRQPLAAPPSHTGLQGGSHGGSGSGPYYLPDPSPSSAPLALSSADNWTPGSYSLPGQADLNVAIARYLGDHLGDHLGDMGRRATPGADTAGNFYFLDALNPVFSDPVPKGLVAPASARPFDVSSIRRDFPILAERVNGRPLVWFDNAATTHKPQVVIDRISHFYAHENSNIHRAAHELAARATDAYEKARSTVARFIGAGTADEIIFVRGTTEAINLIANTFGRQFIGEGDEIIVSELEHHANIVPWYQLARQVGAKLRVIPVDDSGQVLLDEYRGLINKRTRLVAVTQVSNALGTITPIREIVDIAHGAGVCVLVDGAQAVSHMPINVRELDADFYVFSGHKVFGPTGIGVVYGKAQLLERLQPWQGGGNMIEDVTFDRVVYQPPPGRFEAGTGNIADAVGLGAALEYLEQIGMERIARYEHELLEHATQGLRQIPGVRLIGTARDKASVQSFVLDGHTPEEVGKALNHEGIAVRSGHHCAQPILRRFGLEATVRPSFAFYNTCEEIDHMLSVVKTLSHGRG